MEGKQRRIIDVWVQHPGRTFLESDIFEPLRRWTKGIVTDLPSQLTVNELDKANVTLGILSAWEGPTGSLISNEEVFNVIKEHPTQFKGLASVNLRKPMKAIAELRKCVKDYGFIGLRLLPWLWELPCNDRRYYPLYAECVQLDIPFCLQVGHTGPMMGSEYGRPIPYLDDVAREFPDLKIVGGHIGYPWTNEMITLATKHPNVYIDTSAYTSKRYPQELVTYMNTNGKEKVLFGSNWPMISPSRCLADLHLLGFSEQTLDYFVEKNAVKVFKLNLEEIQNTKLNFTAKL